MAKELRLEEGYLDDNIRPLKINGEKTSLEISKSCARVTGGLEVDGPGKPIVAQPLITTAIHHPDLPIDTTLVIKGHGGNNRLLIDEDYIWMKEIAEDHYAIEFKYNGTGGLGPYLKFSSILDDGDYSILETGSKGATSLTTVDDDGEDADLTFVIDGDTIIDRNVALTTAGTYTGLSIDFDKTGASTSDNTLYGLNIDIDNTTATNGTNTMYGIRCTPNLQHAADAGTVECIGGYFSAATGANGTTTSAGVRIDQGLVGDTKYGLQIRSTANTDDFFAITLAANGVTTLSTTDADTAVGHLTLDPDGDINLNAIADVNIPANIGLTFGDAGEKIEGNGSQLSIASSSHLTVDAGGTIILDSATGAFEMHGGGTTAKFADMYAGMILGYRVVGLNEAHATYNLTTSYVVPTDEFGVTFIVPPSGNVEISIQVWFSAGSSGQSLLGSISSGNNTDGYAQIADEYEQSIFTTPARNAFMPVAYSWVLAGLTAGDSNTTYAAFKTANVTGTPKVLWGGSNSGRYPDFIMRATALPATILT